MLGIFCAEAKVERILMLIYHCPTTTRIVRTSIEASEADLWRFRSLKLSLWCPHCQIGHSILAKDTQLDANQPLSYVRLNQCRLSSSHIPRRGSIEPGIRDRAASEEEHPD